MKEENYNDLSNTDLKLRLKNINDEYESLKITLSKTIESMKLLTNKYKDCQGVLDKRTNFGIF